MSVRFNRLANAGRSMKLVPKIGVAVAFFATVWISSLAHSSTEIQRPRQQVHQVSNTSQTVLPGAPVCEPFVQSATNNFEAKTSLGPQVSAKSVNPSERMGQTSAAPTGQNSTQVLISIGQRVREIENQIALVLAITREFGQFEQNEKSLRTSVAGEISALQGIRENFKSSNRLGKNDELLATALERQQNLIAPYRSLKGALSFLSDWRQDSSNSALLTEIRQELEQASQRAVTTGRGASHHAKIVDLLSVIGRFEDLISSSWFLTQQNLEAAQDLFARLWGEQTLAVLDASRHTDRFSYFPINQVIAEGIENLRPTRGDLGREPENELVIEKSIYGYDLLYVEGKLAKMNATRNRADKRDYMGASVSRNNIALLDPNLSVEGISRGTILTEASRFFKSQSMAVLGFFPNGDVLVQELTKPGVRPKIKSISLNRAKRMKSVGTSNINRMPLIGDVTYAPSGEDLAKGKVSLYSTKFYFKGLHSRSTSAVGWGGGVFRVLCGAAGTFSCALGGALAGIGGVFGHAEMAAFGFGLLANGGAALALAYSVPMALSRGHEEYSGSGAVTRSNLEWLPGSPSLMLRSEDLWIGSDSLTSDEREALGIREGEDFLVSTIGEKLRIGRPGSGED